MGCRAFEKVSVLTSKEKIRERETYREVTGRGEKQQLLYRNVQRFRGGLVFEAHRLCVSLNSRLESNKEEECPAVFSERDLC